MKDMIFNRVYNTETSTPVKYFVDVEDLGEGYTRYSTKVVYYKDKDDCFFLYVKRVTTEWNCQVFDIQEYIVPVTDEWARKFNRATPEIYLKGRPPGKK